MIDIRKERCYNCGNTGRIPEYITGPKYVKRIGWYSCSRCNSIQEWNRRKDLGWMGRILEDSKDKPKEKFWRKHEKRYK